MGEHVILVVGPDAAGRAMLAAAVAAASYAVVSAGADDAPACLRQIRPAAVVLDMMRLPAGVAVDLVRSIRATTVQPLLVVVAAHDDAAGTAALDAGADDFLRSPLAAPELRARLHAHLRPRRARQTGCQ